MTVTGIEATPETIRATSAAMGRASLYDDYFGIEDSARLAAWAEAVQRFDLEQHHLLNAVTTFYAGTPQGRLGIGELIRLARQVRQDGTMKQESVERQQRGITSGLTPAAAIAGPDRQLGGLPIGGADGDPVWDAYDVNGAIDRDCPTCGEPAGGACVNAVNDSARKIPCMARVRSPK